MEISEEVKSLYRWQSSLDDVARAGTTACIFADFARDALAKLLKAEALIVWLANWKDGPIPDQSIESYKAEAERLLRGE